MAEEEHYVSGEEYQKLHQTSTSQPRKVTIPLRLVALVIGVIVLCVVSFIGGASYQKHHTKPTLASTTSTTNSGFGGGGGFSRRGNGSIGQVTAISSTSITLTNQRTSASDTYAITSSTTITDSGQTVTASDIQVGDTVLVTTSASATTTATSILVNPSFGGGFGGQGGGTSSQSN